MFVGHYAVALAAKAAQPRAPLWTYVAGCQLLDIGWSGLVMAGVEKVRFDAQLPGSNLDLWFMPYTHSLPAALAWSVAAALLVRLLVVRAWAPAVTVGLVVFSHWVLDLLVHRPDLALWFGGPKVGLGFWNLPVPEATTEMLLLALAGGAWIAAIKTAGAKAWPALVFIALLGALQLVAELPMPGTPTAFDFGRTALIAYLVATLLSLAFDRPKPKRG